MIVVVAVFAVSVATGFCDLVSALSVAATEPRQAIHVAVVARLSVEGL